jgi:RNA polymerase sigma factor (sigma-70 family)
VKSLDKPIGEDAELTLGSLLPHPQSETAIDQMLAEIVGVQVRQALAALTERERDVVMRRFGLDGPQPATLAEVARELGISRERVRQIEKEALAKLRRGDLAALVRAA